MSDYPPAEIYGNIYNTNPEKALRAAYLGAVLMAKELLGVGINVDCKKKALITEKKHLELALSEFADDFKTESMRNWKNANCKNMIFNTDTGWSTTQIIRDVNENLVLKLEANFRICSQ